ncbi:hypothetical protein BJY00DRAFT_150685 [Aspergillus carlsbadensis]|nr:hypothetical protein BJY00DRAFT_150685 [Aspergillus carlsbadensis]
MALSTIRCLVITHSHALMHPKPPRSHPKFQYSIHLEKPRNVHRIIGSKMGSYSNVLKLAERNGWLRCSGLVPLRLYIYRNRPW